MVFSSIPFLFFLLVLFLLIYSAVPKNIKNYVLLAFSLIFYAWGEPVYIVLMIIETFSDYLVGRVMVRADGAKRKLLLTWSLLVDLGVLGFFKYADFLTGTINSVFNTDIKKLELALPVGISFFTFQSLSYVIDLYKREIEAEKSYINYLTYVSMFPQLVAGPIVRYSTVSREIKDRNVSMDDFCQGFMRFLRGLFKKVLLANQAGQIFDAISAGIGSASVLSAWLGAVAFTFQIYFDFSGYSDMAIGLGRMMGFHFDENFKHPLASKSVTDFWRRWHISLSSWFRNYVYIPLGGNRVSAIKNIRNIFVVWALTGLWHGASWNFVIWGLYYAVLLILEKRVYGKLVDKMPALIGHIYSFIIVTVGFVIFSKTDFTELTVYLKTMFGFGEGQMLSRDIIWYLKNNAAVLALCCLFSFPLYRTVKEKLQSFNTGQYLMAILTPVIYVLLFMLSVAGIVNDSYNPFLYFRF